MRSFPWRPAVVAFLLMLYSGAGSISAAAPGQVVYLLGKQSAFQRGCFAPCECPVVEQGTVRGSFVLSPAGSDPLFTHYDVLGVSWVVKTSSGDFRVTGSGTYRIGGEFALQHELTLDLSLDGAAPQHFDSGLVQGGGEFPVIDINVSLNGIYCFDTVFYVRAHPALDVKASDQEIWWTPAPSGMSYDVVMGDLRTLGHTGGSYAASTLACMMNGDPTAALDFTGNPPIGTGYWYLVRPSAPGGPGTYDAADASQSASRDPGITASGVDCP